MWHFGVQRRKIGSSPTLQKLVTGVSDVPWRKNFHTPCSDVEQKVPGAKQPKARFYTDKCSCLLLLWHKRARRTACVVVITTENFGRGYSWSPLGQLWGGRKNTQWWSGVNIFWQWPTTLVWEMSPRCSEKAIGFEPFREWCRWNSRKKDETVHHGKQSTALNVLCINWLWMSDMRR